MPITNVSDDNLNAGTPYSPATNAGQPRVVQPNEIDSTGQKRTNTDSNYNSLSTAIRRVNPLAQFSSWNYQLTFYMVTPVCFNFFQQTGKLNPDGGWYIIAQSGGVNSDREPRAVLFDQTKVGLGPGLDYYINDFSIETYMAGADGSKTSTTNAEVNFKIIEPTGFTLVTKLQRTSNIINSTSKEFFDGVSPTSLPSLYQQHYLIGVKFYGYGADGELYTNSAFPEYNQALNDKFGLFERIFPILISEFNFKVDGRSTVYNIKAAVANLHTAYSNKRGLVNQNMELEGTTLGDIIGTADGTNKKSLMAQLNGQQFEYKYGNQIIKWTQKYNVEWLDGADVKKEELINCPLTSRTDYIQQTAGMSNALKIEQVTVKQEQKSNVIATSKKITGISPGTNIARVLDNLIVKSNFVADPLIRKYDQKIETDATPTGNIDVLNWFIINPVIQIIKRDPATNDWAYDITYQIRPYKIPYIRNPNVTKKSKYYGPVKLYEYAFTGGNTEIINWEMSYDNLFYVVQNTATSNTGLPPDGSTTPLSHGGGQNSDPSGNLLNNGGLSQENVRATLYSVGDITETRFRIMGDPDFLMTAIGSKVQSTTFSSFVNGDLSISPYAGQIFIEIVFKVAEDYKDDGLLDVDMDQKVAFYPFNKQKIAGNQGLVFKINKVTSYFNNGKFEQELHAFMVPIEELIMSDDQLIRQRETAPTATTDGGQGRGRSPGATLADATEFWNQPQQQIKKGLEQNAANSYAYTGFESAIVSGVDPSQTTTYEDDDRRIQETNARRQAEREAQAERIREINRATSSLQPVPPVVNGRVNPAYKDYVDLKNTRQTLNDLYRTRPARR